MFDGLQMGKRIAVVLRFRNLCPAEGLRHIGVAINPDRTGHDFDEFPTGIGWQTRFKRGLEKNKIVEVLILKIGKKGWRYDTGILEFERCFGADDEVGWIFVHGRAFKNVR